MKRNETIFLSFLSVLLYKVWMGVYTLYPVSLRLYLLPTYLPMYVEYVRSVKKSLLLLAWLVWYQEYRVYSITLLYGTRLLYSRGSATRLTVLYGYSSYSTLEYSRSIIYSAYTWERYLPTQRGRSEVLYSTLLTCAIFLKKKLYYLVVYVSMIVVFWYICGWNNIGTYCNNMQPDN